MPIGKEIIMLQIIVEEKLFEKDADKLDVKERATPTKLGKDPYVNKTGVNNFVSCLSGYYAQYKIMKTNLKTNA